VKRPHALVQIIYEFYVGEEPAVALVLQVLSDATQQLQRGIYHDLENQELQLAWYTKQWEHQQDIGCVTFCKGIELFVQLGATGMPLWLSQGFTCAAPLPPSSTVTLNAELMPMGLESTLCASPGLGIYTLSTEVADTVGRARPAA